MQSIHHRCEVAHNLADDLRRFSHRGQCMYPEWKIADECKIFSKYEKRRYIYNLPTIATPFSSYNEFRMKKQRSDASSSPRLEKPNENHLMSSSSSARSTLKSTSFLGQSIYHVSFVSLWSKSKVWSLVLGSPECRRKKIKSFEKKKVKE